MKMNLTCHRCGFTADHLEFTYLCRNGCPACGESDLRQCPHCGTQCVFSRAESLENEEIEMRALAHKLSEISKTDDPTILREAKDIISRLYTMNRRWNIKELNQFLLKRQKELFF
jgi:hypothetical protein